MNTRKLFSVVIAAAIGSLLLVCCGKEYSRTTGWQYNTSKNGGFELPPYQGQITGPGLVFIEGGQFEMGRTEEDVMKDWDNFPRTVTVSSFYLDETEITNQQYRDYLHWLGLVYVPADLVSVYNAALPDTTVWRKRLAYNEPMVEYYFRVPDYRDFPVVGVSWTQAMKYCAWRSDRVNEDILIKHGLINMTSEPSAEGHFNTQAYLLYPDYENNSDRRLQYIATGEDRNARLEDGILLPKYRLPTEAEWEFAALGLVGNTLQERILERRTYPWNGQIVRTDDKKYMGAFVDNLRRGRGDYMGVASNLNDRSEYTNYVFDFWPNDYGLYGMAGNVAEWVLDVYRQLSYDEMVDLNPYRGNVYATVDVLDDGTVAERDETGAVPMVPVSDFKNDRRRNYRSADNINYLDGDWASQLDPDRWKNAGEPDIASREMYDKNSYPLGTYSMVDNKAMVYKGGSWQDIQYWASPGQRRFLDKDESTDYIGFRCAMDRMGPSTTGKKRR